MKPGALIQQVESWAATTFGPRTPLHSSLPVTNRQCLVTINRRCLVAQPCLTLCNPLDYSPQSYPVHELFQARILEWVAISSFRGSSWPRDQTHISCVSCISDRFLTAKAPGNWKKESEKWSCSVVSDSLRPHGPYQARILQWVAISFSRTSSQPRGWTQVSCIVGRCFNLWATRETHTFFLPVAILQKVRLTPICSFSSCPIVLL